MRTQALFGASLLALAAACAPAAARSPIEAGAADLPSAAALARALNSYAGQIDDKLPVHQGKGPGDADDTAALNRFAATHPTGFRIANSVKISGTVQLASASVLACNSSEKVMIDDTAVVGPGLRVGRPGLGSAAPVAAGSFEMRGCWMYNALAFDNGAGWLPGTSTRITNRKTQGEAHLAIYGGQHVRIEGSWFWDAPVGIDCQSCVDVKIVASQFHGLWDDAAVDLQQSLAAIRIQDYLPPAGASPALLGTLQTIEILGNQIAGGYLSPLRFVPIGTLTKTAPGCIPRDRHAAPGANNPPADGSQRRCAPWYQENIGMRFGVWVQSAEGFWYHHNYSGGQNASALAFDVATFVDEAETASNFLEAIRLYTISITSAEPGFATMTRACCRLNSVAGLAFHVF